MTRGRITPPNLDDRTWQDLVDQARALIPRYAPEWTDHNPSDLGITLIEMFAWLVEGMGYRMNQIPERQFVAFLRLLQITRDPATPANTFLTYTLAPGTAPTVLAAGALAATQPRDDDPPLVFETDEDATLIATNLTHAAYIRKGIPTNKYNDVTTEIATAPVDGLRISIPAAPDSIMINLGFDTAVTNPIRLRVKLREPLAVGDAGLTAHFSDGSNNPAVWPTIGAVVDDTDDFSADGDLVVTPPLGWVSENPTGWTTPPDTAADTIDVARFWIGIRLTGATTGTRNCEIEHVLFNAVPATNARTVIRESLGASDGSKFQEFEFKNRPVFKENGVADPYQRLVVEVRSPTAASPGTLLGPWTTWRWVEEFAKGPGSVFRLDPVVGSIDFGSYDRASAPEGHGTIPPVGSEIRVTYRYVAGDSGGNAAPATITVVQTPTPGVIAVTNHVAADQGSDEESLDEAKRRAPTVLRNRYRAVTAEDYEYLALEATTDVAKVRCLEPRLFTSYDGGIGTIGQAWTYGGLNRNIGHVNVLVVPKGSSKVPRPTPSDDLIREVSDYLQSRRTITASVHVTGPRYLPIRVVNLEYHVWQQAIDRGLAQDPAAGNQERDAMLAKIRAYLHPTLGGPDGEGWAFGQSVLIAGLLEAIQPPAEIGYIRDIQIEAAAPPYSGGRPYPIATPVTWIRLADYEIVCSADAAIGLDHSISVVAE